MLPYFIFVSLSLSLPAATSPAGDRHIGGREGRARGRDLGAAEGERASRIRSGCPSAWLQNPVPRGADALAAPAAHAAATAGCVHRGPDCEGGHFLPASRLHPPPLCAATAARAATAATTGDDAGGSLF